MYKQSELFDLNDFTEAVIPVQKEIYMVSAPSLGSCLLHTINWLSKNRNIKIENFETTADTSGWTVMVTYE